MESGQHAREVGRHLLGPHVVGQRVVVRRVLPGEAGPTGGPAMTDVLGVCTSWGDGTCVVAPESGAPVEIAISDIVSGKPVPPRPSVRQRVSPAAAEAHVLSLWPHIEAVPLGEWTLRSDPAPVGRLRRRANSCLAMGDPGMELSAAARHVEDFYAERGRPVMVQVERGSATESGLAEEGWVPLGDGDADFLIASLAQTSRRLRATSRLRFEDLLEGQGSGPVSVGLAHGERDVALELRQDGKVVGSGRAALSGDWVGVHALDVAPEHRRRGLARRMLAELLEWGGEQGAATVWLHVETDNQPALALYESLGFRTHHSLRYLTCGPTGE